MENNIPQITFAIASKNNFRYVKYAVKYIRENCYRKDHIIFIGIDGEDKILSEWIKEQIQNGDCNLMVSNEKSGIAAIYNDIALKSPTDFIIIYHADMIAGKNIDLNLYKNWKKGLIISATRIEPPLHPSDPSKIVENFGMWPEENVEDGFKKEKFNQFVENNLSTNKITKGVFAPWLIHKEDYWDIGGHDENFNSHSEDRDLFNRFLLNGFDFIQPWNALVYHLTCRGGQFEHAIKTNDLKTKSNNWNKLANKNTKKFIRKWGTSPLYNEYQYPIIAPKYDIGFKIKNCNSEFLELLEPWCSTILIDDEMQILTSFYLDEEQKNTIIDLSKKIRSTPFQTLENEIIVEINRDAFTNQDFQIIQNLPEIIKNSGDIGKFQLYNLIIKIRQIDEYQNFLIKL
jgi:hypothetical protein